MHDKLLWKLKKSKKTPLLAAKLGFSRWSDCLLVTSFCIPKETPVSIRQFPSE